MGPFFFSQLNFPPSLGKAIQITILIEVRKKGFFDAVFEACRKGFLIFLWLENEQLQSSYKVSGLESMALWVVKFSREEYKIRSINVFLD